MKLLLKDGKYRIEIVTQLYEDAHLSADHLVKLYTYSGDFHFLWKCLMYFSCSGIHMETTVLLVVCGTRLTAQRIESL